MVTISEALPSTVHHQRANLQTTIAQFRQAIALQPDLWETHHYLGIALQQQGQLEDASACYQTALQLNPNCGDIYLQLGKLYQTQQRFAEAMLAYRQGLMLVNPHYAAAIADQVDAVSLGISIPPLISHTTVTVGAETFPALLPIAHPEQPRPFWSVVIPVYNRADFLLECLASVLAQWRGTSEMEIIVLDDASSISDTLVQLTTGIGQGIITYYRNPHSLGLPGNWNAGLSLSRGQWIHLLHDDDYPLPGFYDHLQQSLQNCPNRVGAAFTAYKNIDISGQTLFVQQMHNQQGIIPDFLNQIGVFNPLNMPAVVIRRRVYERLGVYHPELTYTSDWELYKRIAAFCDWWYEPEVLACYRQHSQSKTTEMMLSGTQVTSIRHAIEMSERYLPPPLGAELTAKSRSYYFDGCLRTAIVPLQNQNLTATWQLLEEALKIDSSPAALSKLFVWLTTEAATPLRQEIASRLLALPLQDDASGGKSHD